MSFLAFALEPEEERNLLWYAPIQRIVYRFFMHAIYMKSLFTALSGKLATGRLFGWDTFDRTNSVMSQDKKDAQSPR